MKKIYFFLFILSFLSISYETIAQNAFFKKAANAELQASRGKVVIQPSKFEATTLDVTKLRSFLWSLPAEKSVANRNQAPVLTLPMPDGSLARFHVWESSIQAPELEAKFREIKTFTGQGIDDPYASIRFDFNPYFGFSAQILSPFGRIYIDPYARGDVDHYISYYQRDYSKETGFRCHTKDSPVPAIDEAGRIFNGPCRGTDLRTYRLAVTCTGEYAQAVGGGAAGPTHAAIVTAVNRVTQVYELELSIRLVLVANNNLVEFLNSGTDPFANDGDSDLDIITSNINSRVGSGNYDIGHLFCTQANAGVAYLGVVCSSSKGGGLTGGVNPVGDGYYIDYVAHEMGHQFGADHTFNTNTCFSSGGSYEPGGGTTIMAYAGICGATENLQPNSDPIFHAYSYDQISKFVAAGGGGNSCGTVTSNGNTLPAINSMTANNLNIPIGTPFTLTASATDANGDAVTYNWEGWDVGAAGTWPSAATSTTRPLFRTRVSKTTGSRTFPDPRVIAANYPGTSAPSAMDGLRGEVLPQVARTMKFRLTVRDNRAGGGGVVSSGDGCQGTAIFQVNAVGTTPFTVSAPNGGETYGSGSTQTITWNVAGTSGSPVNCANVRISLSTDGGLTFPTEIIASTPNDGSQSVTLPAVTSTTARIKVEAVGNIFFDISNANFTISGTPPACAAPTGLATSSITQNSATVSWTAASGASSYDVDYKTTASSTWISAAAGTTATSAGLSSLSASTAYDWRVRTNCTSGSSTYATGTFTTTAPPSGCLTAYEPNETQGAAATVSTNTAISAAIGSATDVDYYKFTTAGANNFSITLTNLAGDYDLYLYNSGGTQIGSSEGSGTSNETITLSNQAAGTYYVRIIGYNGAFSTTVCYNLNIGATPVSTGCASTYDNSTNGTSGGAATIPFNTDIKGLISPSGDNDYYRFVITTGGTATITLTTLPADYDVILYSSNGTTQLASSANGGTSSETISRTYTAGTYFVRVFGYNNANNATNCYTLRVALGTASRNEDWITTGKAGVFPNPVKDVLNIRLPQAKGNTSISLFDMYGRRVIQTNTTATSTSVQVGKLSAGIYIVKIESEGKEETFKIVKE